MIEITRHAASQTDDHGYDDRTIETLYSFIRDAFNAVGVCWEDWTSLSAFKGMFGLGFIKVALERHYLAMAIMDHYTDGEVLADEEKDTLYRAADRWDSLDRAGRDQLTIERLANELARETAHHRRACEALRTAGDRALRAEHHLSEAKKSRDHWKTSAQSYRRQMLALRAGDTEAFKAEQRDRLRVIATRSEEA